MSTEWLVGSIVLIILGSLAIPIYLRYRIIVAVVLILFVTSFYLSQNKRFFHVLRWIYKDRKNIVITITTSEAVANYGHIPLQESDNKVNFKQYILIRASSTYRKRHEAGLIIEKVPPITKFILKNPL